MWSVRRLEALVMTKFMIPSPGMNNKSELLSGCGSVTGSAVFKVGIL